jgi:6-phosphogluconate dehydrogenase
MKFGLVGLGRIGGGLARQAIEKGHQVVGYDSHPESIQPRAQEGLEPALSLDELVHKLDAPCLIRKGSLFSMWVRAVA